MNFITKKLQKKCISAAFGFIVVRAFHIGVRRASVVKEQSFREHFNIFIMKTSATQFEMLVNFMEQYGDINKPTKDARGRVKAIEHWSKLTNLLNADPAGESKVTEKWKKVWSDLKNNTKKKAAKINKAAGGTGGGPALLSKLTDLEQRVLNIIGNQAATGLVDVVESGFSQEPEPNIILSEDRTITLPPTPPLQVIPEESPTVFTVQMDDYGVWNHQHPGPSHVLHIPPPPIESPFQMSPLQEGNHTPPPPPAASHHPDRRRRGPTARRNLMSLSPRRRRPLSYVEQAADHFLNADLEWRNFVKQQHTDNKEIELKKLQLKERELESQKRWQDISMAAIAALNKIVEGNLKTK